MTLEDQEWTSVLRAAWQETRNEEGTEDSFLERLRKTRDLLIKHPPPGEPGAHLLVVKADIRPYWITMAERCLIGRTETNDLVLRHPWVSDEHCVIEREGDDWILRDRGSRNGTLVNGREVKMRALCRGDALEIANWILIFVPAEHTEMSERRQDDDMG